jgi:hypothetical protein
MKDELCPPAKTDIIEMRCDVSDGGDTSSTKGERPDQTGRPGRPGSTCCSRVTAYANHFPRFLSSDSSETIRSQEEGSTQSGVMVQNHNCALPD